MLKFIPWVFYIIGLKSCVHDWTKWGEPMYKHSYQYRRCRKCNVVEQRSM